MTTAPTGTSPASSARCAARRASSIQNSSSAFVACLSLVICLGIRQPRVRTIVAGARTSWLVMCAAGQRLEQGFWDFVVDGILYSVMGIPKLLRKVFLLDLLQGLKVTFRNQDPREIYTEQYPLQRPQVAERYRGAPRLNVNPDTNETMCIACDLCALACPENLIVVSSERNENTRRKELTNFTYDLSRCMFCGLCEDACPVDALELTQDFELASYTREGWIWDRKTLEEGPQPTQYKK